MKKINKQAAFTLIEIVAALAVLSLGILSIISLFPVGQQASEKSGKLSRGTLLGQKKLEEILRETREVFSWDGALGLKDDDQGVFSGEESFFEWEYDASPPPDTNKLVFVSLGIYWPANAGRSKQQSVKFATYISDYS